jgi:hypothetical protein
LDGDYWGGISRRIDILDASSGIWSVDFLSTERAAMSAIAVNNKIYWGGGVVISTKPDVGYESTNAVEIKDLITNTTSFDCLSEPKEEVTALKKDNKIIFFGRQAVRFDIYDLTTQAWSIGLLPQGVLPGSVFSFNNTIYVAGAELNGVLSGQVWKLEF